MRSRLKITAFILAVGVLVLSTSAAVSAAMYKSYVYDAWGEAVPTPEPYLPMKMIFGEDLGVGSLKSPQDLVVAGDSLYIVDASNNRIIKVNEDFQVTAVYNQFEHDGIVDKLKNPHSVFVTDAGDIFIADKDNERIVVLDADGQYQYQINSPADQMPSAFPPYFRFRPTKIAVDRAQRIYVIVDGLYEGLLQLDKDGKFRGFVGAPRVSVSLWEYLWSRIASDEQRKRMRLTLPAEFSSMDLDEEGFIFATAVDSELGVDQMIRRLNPVGTDILARAGTHPPMGDLYSGMESQITGYSYLIDIKSRENGIYSVLDRRRGRVFTYDGSGNLLYVFGGVGQGLGLFTSPVALEEFGGCLLVLDNASNSITVFKQTEYAALIHKAVGEYNTGKYEAAAETWHQVLTYCVNNELAYSGIGRAKMSEGDYVAAMHYYRLGNDRVGYSKAFYRYRYEYINDHLSSFMTSLLIISLAIYAAVRLNAAGRLRQAWSRTKIAAGERIQNSRPVIFLKKTGGELKYGLHVIFHPFDGFWDLKHEARGSAVSATIILVLVSLSYVFARQYTGFAFNYTRIEELNMFMEFISVIVPFLLWSAVNWALTTLMDGKGTIRDIYIAGAYALTPIFLVNIPAIIISNYITIDEGTFYYLFLTLATAWALILLFLGTGVIHDYSLGKTVLTTIATIIGMGIVIFVSLLFVDVIDRIFRFFGEIYIEVSFRTY